MSYLTYFDLIESLIVSSYGGPQEFRAAVIKAAKEGLKAA